MIEYVLINVSETHLDKIFVKSVTVRAEMYDVLARIHIARICDKYLP